MTFTRVSKFFFCVSRPIKMCEWEHVFLLLYPFFLFVRNRRQKRGGECVNSQECGYLCLFWIFERYEKGKKQKKKKNEGEKPECYGSNFFLPWMCNLWKLVCHVKTISGQHPLFYVWVSGWWKSAILFLSSPFFLKSVSGSVSLEWLPEKEREEMGRWEMMLWVLV